MKKLTIMPSDTILTIIYVCFEISELRAHVCFDVFKVADLLLALVQVWYRSLWSVTRSSAQKIVDMSARIDEGLVLRKGDRILALW